MGGKNITLWQGGDSGKNVEEWKRMRREVSIVSVGVFSPFDENTVELRVSPFIAEALTFAQLNGKGTDELLAILLRGGGSIYKPKKVIYHDPATIVYWNDGTKTVVKCDLRDTYSKESGLALCYMKKMLGSSRAFNDVLKEWAE